MILFFFQDGTLSLADFCDALQENEVQRVIRAYENSVTIDIHCAMPTAEWQRLPGMPFARQCRIRVNPKEVLDPGCEAIDKFIGELKLLIN